MATLAEVSYKPYWEQTDCGAMKELKMFPQITEETEENLLNLEEGRLSCSPPSSSSSTEAPSSPSYEQSHPAPCAAPPTITTELVASSPASPTALEPEFAPPARVRMRSLSGGAPCRLAPDPASAGRTRRQSGDDVLSPTRRAQLFEHFRPRSKSDSKGKRPTFLTSLKNSLFSGGGAAPQPQQRLAVQCSAREFLPPEQRQRPRSGSVGPMSKVIDLFRSRSHSVSTAAPDQLTVSDLVDFLNRRVKGKAMVRAEEDSLMKICRSKPPNEALLRRHSVDPDTRYRRVKPFRTPDGRLGESSFPPDDEPGDSRIDYAALDDDKIIPTFMSSHVCYNAMPKSGKVIILSTDLLIKNAFSSLLVNEIRSAPLWDSTTHSFVGILTITDFINVLRHYHYTSKEDIHAIEDQQIQTWRRLTNVTKPFVKIGPCDSLADAAKALIQEGVHRLPVFDDKRNSVLFILSSRRLLQYLHQNLLDKFETSTVKTPSFMKKTVGELRIGTYEDIATVSPETKVIQALDIFVLRNISSLPVVENSRLTNIFAKFDVFALAKEQTYHNLNMSISEALDKAGVHEEICVVTMNESLEAVICKFVTYKVHRVVVIDEKNNSIIGMISLSDILKYLIVQPLDSLGDSVVANDTIEEEGALCGSTEQEPKEATESELQSSFDVSKPESEELSEELVKLSVTTGTGQDQTN